MHAALGLAQTQQTQAKTVVVTDPPECKANQALKGLELSRLARIFLGGSSHRRTCESKERKRENISAIEKQTRRRTSSQLRRNGIEEQCSVERGPCVVERVDGEQRRRGASERVASAEAQRAATAAKRARDTRARVAERPRKCTRRARVSFPRCAL